MNNLSAHAVDLGQMYRRAEVHPLAAVEAQQVAKTLHSLTHKPIYEEVVAAIGNGMPWEFIAVLHYRENSQLKLEAYLGNGQLLCGTGKKSTIVPIGRGPFKTFKDGAVDCITHLNLNHATDWDIEACLERAEVQNGQGYFLRHVVNPYLWAGTNLYTSGKFVSDGHYDPKAVDKQIGVGVLFKALGIA